MNQVVFVERRRPAWEELERTLDDFHSGRPDTVAVRRLGRLHRRAAADLAVAQARFPESSIVPYLNGLVAEGHSRLYGRQLVVWRRARLFLLDTFPRTLKETANYTFAAAAVFGATALVAFLVVTAVPELAESILPAQVVADTVKEGADVRFPADQRPAISAFITTNNIQVSFMAFALGIFFGIGTVYLLALNGIMLGALAAVFARPGFSLEFWALIVPHGVLELPAIFIAAAAGLIMGSALLRPGEIKRTVALRRASEQAVVLMGGVIPIFIVAGLIEGFITPLPIPEMAKIGISLVVGVFGWVYVTGRFMRLKSSSRSKLENAT